MSDNRDGVNVVTDHKTFADEGTSLRTLIGGRGREEGKEVYKKDDTDIPLTLMTSRSSVSTVI